MKTKILTKFKVYILTCSHFKAISSTYQVYSVLTVKSSFCEHHPSNNGHNFKSWNDTAMKFGRNATNVWIWKVKKIGHQKYFHLEVIDDLLLGGTLYLPPILGRVNKKRRRYQNIDCLMIMHRSNCSAPIPTGQPRGQRINVSDKKGRGTCKKSDWSVYIGRGKAKM